MKVLKLLKISAISWSLLTSTHASQTRMSHPAISSMAKKEQSISIVNRFMTDQRRRYSIQFKGEIPKQLIEQDDRKTGRLANEIEERIKLYETGKISELGLRLSLSRANIAETKRLKRDITQKVKRMDTRALDHYAEVFEKNPTYSEQFVAYLSAFTRTEKAKVIIEAMHVDLDATQSASLKKIKWLNPEALIADMRKTADSFKPKLTKSSKSDRRARWNRILMQAGRAIAIVGMVSWGFATLRYGGRYNDRVDELQADYDARRNARQTEYNDMNNHLRSIRDQINAANQAQLNGLITELEGQYKNLNTELTNNEMSYLEENGFVRTLCNQYEAPTANICNNYDYAVFSGKKLCTVMCYKNVTTGQETLHEAPVCQNMSLPADCYSYSRERDDYTSGYNDAYDPAYRDGYYDGSQDGTYDGDYDGANDGYNDGNLDGYFDGEADGYNDGFDDGYRDGFDDRWLEGYDDGYYWGYEDGLDDIAEEDDTTYDDSWDDSTDTYTCDPFYEVCDDSWDDTYWDEDLDDWSYKMIKSKRGKYFKKGYKDGLLDALILREAM